MIEIIDKTAEANGTPLNRKTLMGMQGFIGGTVIFSGNQIVETNTDGNRLVTTFNADGSITEVFTGEKTITKTTTFGADGAISEVIS